MYEFEVHAASAASREEVWDVLVDSRRWPEWTGLPTPTMEREGVPAPYGLGAVRRFAWEPVGAREEVIEWDPPRRYGYAVIGGMPIRAYHATVSLEQRGTGTAIAWRGVFEKATVPGLSRPLRWFTRAALRRFARGLGEQAGRAHEVTTKGESGGS